MFGIKCDRCTCQCQGNEVAECICKDDRRCPFCDAKCEGNEIHEFRLGTDLRQLEPEIEQAATPEAEALSETDALDEGVEQPKKKRKAKK